METPLSEAWSDIRFPSFSIQSEMSDVPPPPPKIAKIPKVQSKPATQTKTKKAAPTVNFTPIKPEVLPDPVTVKPAEQAAIPPAAAPVKEESIIEKYGIYVVTGLLGLMVLGGANGQQPQGNVQKGTYTLRPQ